MVKMQWRWSKGQEEKGWSDVMVVVRRRWSDNDANEG
jgi:hypothetical protein